MLLVSFVDCQLCFCSMQTTPQPDKKLQRSHEQVSDIEYIIPRVSIYSLLCNKTIVLKFMRIKLIFHIFSFYIHSQSRPSHILSITLILKVGCLKLQTTRLAQTTCVQTQIISKLYKMAHRNRRVTKNSTTTFKMVY